MRRTEKHAAVTRNEHNTADGRFLTASEGKIVRMKRLARGMRNEYELDTGILEGEQYEVRRDRI
jgi:hypothetical protein